MSFGKWSKVVRTESMLDENKIYFSHVISPLKKNKQPNDVRKNTATTARPHNHYYQHNGCKGVTEKGYYENVDVEAEKFIRKKHQNFELSLWKSNHNNCKSYSK
uniref:Uncharacterized protein n=1 Tax=Chenopodium quinoa TaxID=63459 RepID=A0A803M740_CHEQI